MKAMVCEMCGSHDLVKQDGMYVCQSCGTKYSTEDAKKLLIEVSGEVKIDTSEELNNLYEIARRAKDDNNSESAQKYYDMILVKDPKSWEAQFYSVYYRCSQCKIGQIESAAITLANSLGNVLGLIKENVIGENEQAAAVNEVTGKCVSIAQPFVNGIWSLYQPDGYYNNPQYFEAKVQKVILIFSVLRQETEARFDADNDAFKGIIEAVKTCEQTIRESSATRTKNEAARKSGCYVATAVYGSYDCPEVWTLRRFRDYTLAETWYGRAFIRTYYAVSPTLVKWFGNTEWFKNMWRPTLDRMVKRLNSDGVKNTPYNDRNW